MRVNDLLKDLKKKLEEMSKQELDHLLGYVNLKISDSDTFAELERLIMDQKYEC